MADIWDTTAAWLSGSRGWQTVLGGALAVLTAASASAVLLPTDPASADTRVEIARAAEVYLPDGTHHPAAEGEVLPRGAELHTGAGGGAQLLTAGRRTYLGQQTTLRIQDGVRDTLFRGLALVDARNGARLDLTTPVGRVATPAGAVSRVEESLLTRVAVYAGTVTLHPVGRTSSTAVPALHQVKVQGQSLPDRVTPLQLDGQAWERAVAADLVSADQQLRDLAEGLSGPEGAKVFRTAPASYRPTTLPAEGPARGEQALGIAVAVAADAADALAQVRAYRADLGSWGVVAALVRAPLNKVSAVLSAALAPATSTPGPTTVDAGGPQVLPGLSPTPSAAPAPTSTETKQPTRPTATPTPTKPTTSASPNVVDGLITTVLTLVSPKPQTPAQPVPTAVPTTQGPCVLGAVLC